MVLDNSILENFYQFNTPGLSNRQNLALKTMWIAVMSYIWTQRKRNIVEFKNALSDGEEIFSVAQMNMYEYESLILIKKN